MNDTEHHAIADLDKRVSVLEARVETQNKSLDRVDAKLDLLWERIEKQLSTVAMELRQHMNQEGLAAKRIVWSLLALILTSGVGLVTLLLNSGLAS